MEQSYPKVEEILSNITLGTKVSIFHGDDGYRETILFEGTVSEYYNSDVPKKDLILIWSTIEDNTFIVEALEDGHPNTKWGER